MHEEYKNKIRTEALNFLKGNKIAVIATVSETGVPHAATVYYIVDDEFNIYFMTNGDSQKANDLRRTKKAAMVVGAGPQISTMQGGGIVETDTFNVMEMTKLIFDRLNPEEVKYWPIKKLKVENIAVFKIKLEWLSWLNFDLENTPAGDYKEGFLKIIP